MNQQRSSDEVDSVLLRLGNHQAKQKRGRKEMLTCRFIERCDTPRKGPKGNERVGVHRDNICDEGNSRDHCEASSAARASL